MGSVELSPVKLDKKERKRLKKERKAKEEEEQRLIEEKKERKRLKKQRKERDAEEEEAKRKRRKPDRNDEPASKKQKTSEFKGKSLEELESLKQSAIQREDYEEAIRIRDFMKTLPSETTPLATPKKEAIKKEEKENFKSIDRAPKAAPETDSDDDAIVSIHDLKKKAGAPKDSDDEAEEKMFEIGRMRKVNVRKFKTSKLVDIREYYSDNGYTKPGKKGISLNEHQFNNLLKQLPHIQKTISEL